MTARSTTRVTAEDLVAEQREEKAAPARTRKPRASNAPDMTNAPKTTDRPKSAAQLEAEGGDYVEVVWEGLTFKILADADEWPFWEVTHPLSSGNVPAALVGLLDTVAGQAFKLRAAFPALTNTQARGLFDAINKAIGLHSTGN